MKTIKMINLKLNKKCLFLKKSQRIPQDDSTHVFI